MKKYSLAILIWIVFEAVAVSLWLTKHNLFYLFNFSYIGISLSFGIFLLGRKYPHVRRVVQLLMGLYMLVYLGLINRENIGRIRYLTFALAFLFVSALFLLKVGNLERIMFWAFLLGNLAYYLVGIALAFLFKDNRAFCKYICPVTVFLKPMSYFSLVRIRCDETKCISCGKCKKVCPMDVEMTDNSRKRKNGTDCILCMECVKVCPKGAL